MNRVLQLSRQFCRAETTNFLATRAISSRIAFPVYVTEAASPRLENGLQVCFDLCACTSVGFYSFLITIFSRFRNNVVQRYNVLLLIFLNFIT